MPPSTPREVRLRPLAPAESAQVMAHAAEPPTLLALSRELFGHAPEAWWLTIPVEDLAFGEGFSPLAQRGMEVALGEAKKLATSSGSRV